MGLENGYYAAAIRTAIQWHAGLSEMENMVEVTFMGGLAVGIRLMVEHPEIARELLHEIEGAKPSLAESAEVMFRAFADAIVIGGKK